MFLHPCTVYLTSSKFQFVSILFYLLTAIRHILLNLDNARSSEFLFLDNEKYFSLRSFKDTIALFLQVLLKT